MVEARFVFVADASEQSTYIHAYIHAYIHTYMNTCMHAYIHAYIPACIHTYIHEKKMTPLFGVMRGLSL